MNRAEIEQAVLKEIHTLPLDKVEATLNLWGIQINAVISINVKFAFKFSSKYNELVNTRSCISLVAQKK